MSSVMPEQFGVPASQQLPRNPMLPPHPDTAAMDSEYSADEAVMRANIVKQYSDILQQLGFSDEQGNFIPGSVATNARRQQSDLQRSSDLAEEDTTNEMQRQNTLFSGYRGKAQARAQYPFQQAMLDLGINVPLQLSQLHEQAAGLADQYTLQNNQLLAAAAQRKAAALAASGGSGAGLSQNQVPTPTAGAAGARGTPGAPGTPGSIFTGQVLTGNETPSQLQAGVATPSGFNAQGQFLNPADMNRVTPDAGVYPYTSETPVAISSPAAPPGGLSANSTQGVFAVDLGNMDYPAPSDPMNLGAAAAAGIQQGLAGPSSYGVMPFTGGGSTSGTWPNVLGAVQNAAAVGAATSPSNTMITDASSGGGYGSTPARDLASATPVEEQPIYQPDITTAAIEAYQQANPVEEPPPWDPNGGGAPNVQVPSSDWWKYV